MKTATLATIAGALLFASSADARWALRPTDVPVTRLLENTRRHVEAHPNDPQGHYVLGRLHSMAFATAKDQLTVAQPLRPSPKSEPGLPKFLPYHSVKVSPAVDDGNLNVTGARLVHLEASVRHYRRAIELAKPRPQGQPEPQTKDDEKPRTPWNKRDEARARLGLAWMLEVASQHREAIATAVRSNALGELRPAQRKSVGTFVGSRDQWRELSLKAYVDAFEATKEGDKKRKHSGPGADSLISLDAAKSIIRIVGRGEATAGQKELAAEMQQFILAMGDIGRVVTPIIFSLRPTRSLAELLRPDHIVRFDLDGDGTASQWPWLRSDTCLLVWDPEQTGQVRDGRQLFGSVTWWIYWDDGYQPLAALDNDRDSWLSGSELRGLSVWRDRDSNGRSDAGEVETVASLGVRRIAASANSRSGNAPAHTAGVELHDGRTAATYDWTPTSLPDAPATPAAASGQE